MTGDTSKKTISRKYFEEEQRRSAKLIKHLQGTLSMIRSRYIKREMVAMWLFAGSLLTAALADWVFGASEGITGFLGGVGIGVVWTIAIFSWGGRPSEWILPELEEGD